MLKKIDPRNIKETVQSKIQEIIRKEAFFYVVASHYIIYLLTLAVFAISFAYRFAESLAK